MFCLLSVKRGRFSEPCSRCRCLPACADGVVSYSMPQGERRGPEVDLFDFTYDGKVSDGYLSGGLGQLMDGVEGSSNFRFDPDNSGRKGYDWVGWKNDSGAGEVRRLPVQIVFEFDRVRNFSSVWFHSNNLFSKVLSLFCLQCFDAVGWAAGRASGL